MMHRKQTVTMMHQPLYLIILGEIFWANVLRKLIYYLGHQTLVTYHYGYLSLFSIHYSIRNLCATEYTRDR